MLFVIQYPANFWSNIDVCNIQFDKVKSIALWHEFNLNDFYIKIILNWSNNFSREN